MNSTKRPRSEVLVSVAFVSICFLAINSLVSLNSVEAQQCTKFLKNETEHFCHKYVTYEYYLPKGPTKWIIEALIYNNAYRAALQSTFTPPECQKGLIPYICSQAFPKCKYNSKGEAVAKPVCKSQCNTVNKDDVCGDFFVFSGRVPQDCSALTTGDDCFTIPTNKSAPEFPFECTYPVGHNPEAYPFPCSLVCPLPLYEQPFVNAVTWWMRIVEPISALALIVFMCAMVYYRGYWFRFPVIYIFYDALGVLISHAGFLIVTFRGSYGKVGCVSDVQNAQGDKWLCTLFHWFLYIGSFYSIY
eukprot:TRINITY_DN10721_c0_g1_i4.p1 TRINITY_DN10721_c0_g1~~TRINITY_DN10721_c0_g1_i4.p1  ORF type:complete len:314 (+),score=45.82 TRINITY_DN10721_c0_g1_i4:38-943(+)